MAPRDVTIDFHLAKHFTNVGLRILSMAVIYISIYIPIFIFVSCPKIPRFQLGVPQQVSEGFVVVKGSLIWSCPADNTGNSGKGIEITLQVDVKSN